MEPAASALAPAIPRGRSHLAVAAMAILALAAAAKLFWLVGPDGADLRAAAPRADAILALLAAAALAYIAATVFAFQARRGAAMLWSGGWLAAVAAQGLIIEQLTRETFERLTLAEAIGQHVFGHALALIFGLFLWRIELGRGWRFRRP